MLFLATEAFRLFIRTPALLQNRPRQKKEADDLGQLHFQRLLSITPLVLGGVNKVSFQRKDQFSPVAASSAELLSAHCPAWQWRQAPERPRGRPTIHAVKGQLVDCEMGKQLSD